MDQALKLAIIDSIQDGQLIAVNHLIKVYKLTKEKTGGNAPLTIDDIIEQLEVFKGQIEENGEG